MWAEHPFLTQGAEVVLQAIANFDSEVVTFHWLLCSQRPSLTDHQETLRFTLEGENNFAHDLPFQLPEKAKQERVPNWERDIYTQQTKDPFQSSILSNLAWGSYVSHKALIQKAVMYILLWCLQQDRKIVLARGDACHWVWGERFCTHMTLLLEYTNHVILLSASFT